MHMIKNEELLMTHSALLSSLLTILWEKKRQSMGSAKPEIVRKYR